MRAAAVLCLVGILIAGGCALAAPAQSPAVTVDGIPHPALMAALIDGQPYLAVSSLTSLHAVVASDQTTGFAAVGIGRRSVLLTVGSPLAMVDGRPVPERLAPRAMRGQIWLPAEWLGLFSLAPAWDDKANILSLRWDDRFLLGVYLDKTGDRPRLILEASAAIKASVFTLRQPDRLVIDLFGLSAYQALGLDERENEYFSRLRAAPNRPGVLRLVVDLRQAVGYRVDETQAGAGRLCLELNTLIYGASVVPADEGHKLVIATNHPPAWTVAAGGSDRVIVNLSRATLLPAVPATAPGDDDWLRGLECRSPAADQVQIVAILVRPLTLAVTPARGNEGLIEVQPMQNLGRLVWREGGGFSLSSSGAMSVSSAVEHYPDRLTLTVSHASAVPDEGALPQGAVRRYQVEQLQPGVVRFTLDLRYDTPFNLAFSKDRHRLDVQFPPSPLAGKAIVLDAGHGGVEPGALGRTQGLREKDINLDVTLRLKELLEGAGAAVYLTRVDDSYVPLFARPSYANRLPADIFVSIHANAHDDPQVNGFESFSYPGKEADHRLAALMHEEMVAALGLLPRGAKTADFAVLRDNQVLSVLIELGFLTNTIEEARLATEEFRRRAAAAVFRAITRFARGETAARGLPGPGLAN